MKKIKLIIVLVFGMSLNTAFARIGAKPVRSYIVDEAAKFMKSVHKRQLAYFADYDRFASEDQLGGIKLPTILKLYGEIKIYSFGYNYWLIFRGSSDHEVSKGLSIINQADGYMYMYKPTKGYIDFGQYKDVEELNTDIELAFRGIHTSFLAHQADFDTFKTVGNYGPLDSVLISKALSEQIGSKSFLKVGSNDHSYVVAAFGRGHVNRGKQYRLTHLTVGVMSNLRDGTVLVTGAGKEVQDRFSIKLNRKLESSRACIEKIRKFQSIKRAVSIYAVSSKYRVYDCVGAW